MMRCLVDRPLDVMPVDCIVVIGTGMQCLFGRDAKKQQAGQPDRKNNMKKPAYQLCKTTY